MASNNINRPIAIFSPSLWTSIFSSLTFSNSELESYGREVEYLKDEVKNMLMGSINDPVENIKFIDLLFRLGVSYHFEEEIEKQLSNTFSNLSDLIQHNNFDLHNTSLLFRVLRQHGFKMSCDVFNKFKDDESKFKQEIADDVRGMLSLYEASFLSVHGEDIMDEALSFTKQNLEDALTRMQLRPHLAKHIKTALILPLHKCITRLAAREYISFYQQEELRNGILLQFAKVDFNRLQLLYQQEISVLLRWWEGLNVMEELPYARDRVLEVFLWVVGCHFEPDYALSRAVSTKNVLMMSIIDDTFDAYGFFKELQLFAEAFERFDIEAIDHLPNYMQFLYRTVLKTIAEAKDIAKEQGKPYGGSHLIEEFKDLVRCYYQEAKWVDKKLQPPFSEYRKIGYTTSNYGVFSAASLIGTRASGSDEFKCLHSSPIILKAVKLVGRFKNDVVSYLDERKRGNCVTAVSCYATEYGVSETKAVEEVEKMISDALKDVNEGCMKPSSVPLLISKFCLNLLRSTETFYRNNWDGYTKPEVMKDNSLIIHSEDRNRLKSFRGHVVCLLCHVCLLF